MAPRPQTEAVIDASIAAEVQMKGLDDKTITTATNKWTDVDTAALDAKHNPVGLVNKFNYWLGRIHWLHVVILFGFPLASIWGAFNVELQTKTVYWAIVMYWLAGVGITAGYHRLWAHQAFTASYPVKVALVLMGSAALEGSIKWWCGGHRVHHRHTDTKHDPYNANGGFWYAHLGWMLVHPKKENARKANIKDLTADPWIRWQHKYYLYVGPGCSLVFPTVVAGLLWGDWMGGLFFAGFMRNVAVHHSTFCVNSVAHYFGEHTYDDDRSPRDSIVTALLTFGEGYHNFHHEFPNDYRNGIRWYHYDPTKWFIGGLSYFGLTNKLRQFPDNEIQRGMVAMAEKKLSARKQNLIYPGPIEDLPVMGWGEIQEEVASKEGRRLVVVQDLVHDLTEFIPNHPGGKALVRAVVGKDATKHFLGESGVYRHSHAAHNLLSNMRVARLVCAMDNRAAREEAEMTGTAIKSKTA